MATWIVHLRIAERFSALFGEEFLVGNLAADCGAEMPDGTFSPPACVTHWLKAGQGKQSCDYIRFAEQYLRTPHTPAERLFLLGYMIHLVTDVLWSLEVNQPIKERYADFYRRDHDGFYRAVKPDWYECDFRFLKAHPDFVPYRMLCSLTQPKFEPDRLLGYYKDGMIMSQMKNICEFYRSNQPCDRKLLYLTETQADSFVELAAERISVMLKEWIEV
ncbi:MAG: zinc dependent phospholipase C family protein [Oscillospiraceae bacterium]